MDVRGAGNKAFQKCSLIGMEFYELVDEMFTRFGSKKLILFVGLACRIWFRRNDIIHRAKFKHPNELMRELHAFGGGRI